VTLHAEDALRRARITQVFDFTLAIAAFETVCAERLVARENCKVFDFVAAGAAAVCAIVADQRAIAEEKQICVGVEECVACVASEAVNMPSVASCHVALASRAVYMCERGSSIYPAQRLCLLRGSMQSSVSGCSLRRRRLRRTKLHPLHGYAASSASAAEVSVTIAAATSVVAIVSVPVGQVVGVLQEGIGSDARSGGGVRIR